MCQRRSGESALAHRSSLPSDAAACLFSARQMLRPPNSDIDETKIQMHTAKSYIYFGTSIILVFLDLKKMLGYFAEVAQPI